MTISAVIDTNGFPRASCICDVCAREEVVPAPHIRQRGKPPSVNEGAVTKKLTQSGWAMVRRKLHCPKCEARRKAFAAEKSKHVVPDRWANGYPDNWRNPFAENSKKENELSGNVTEIRSPTREQRRQIMELLTDSYDTKAERYLGTNTDKSLAECIGGGVMPGWVAEIREEFFGPDGGNDEIEDLLSSIREWREAADKHASECHKANQELIEKLCAFNAAREQVAELAKRVEAIKQAVGPKAARA